MRVVKSHSDGATSVLTCGIQRGNLVYSHGLYCIIHTYTSSTLVVTLTRDNYGYRRWSYGVLQYLDLTNHLKNGASLRIIGIPHAACTTYSTLFPHRYDCSGRIFQKERQQQTFGPQLATSQLSNLVLRPGTPATVDSASV